MNVLVCPASFKGFLSAREAAEAMAQGAREAGHRAVVLPLADGGEGTLDVFLACGGQAHAESVQGPYGEKVAAAWVSLADGTAVVEMAQASGLAQIAVARRNLPLASSFGTGQLIAAALKSRPKRLLIGLGGSATNDGGMGAMKALGARFFDERGEDIADAGALSRLSRIELPSILRDIPVVIASDVDNPLTGPDGATRTFGPQKGGTAEVLDLLEAGMERYASVLRQVLGWDVASAAGAGAAGGIGAALLGFLGGRFQPGIDLVMDALGFDQVAQDADLMLTGEGRLDAQSLHGKAVAGVLRRSSGKRVIAVCGRVDLPERDWRAWGLFAAHASSPDRLPADPEEAARGVRVAARQVLSSVTDGRTPPK